MGYGIGVVEVVVPCGFNFFEVGIFGDSGTGPVVGVGIVSGGDCVALVASLSVVIYVDV